MSSKSSSFSINGLNHIGIVVEDIAKAKSWFIETLGLKLLQDRGEMFFFLAGRDVIAAKTKAMAVAKPEHGHESKGENKAGWQSLDHYGFYAKTKEEVDVFAEHIAQHGAEIIKGPYDRSDGRSVYFKDPNGLVGEYLFFDASVY